eukprot:gene9231-1658_t
MCFLRTASRDILRTPACGGTTFAQLWRIFTKLVEECKVSPPHDTPPHHDLLTSDPAAAVPVFAKTRIFDDLGRTMALMVLSLVPMHLLQDCGVSLITVHGRTKEQVRSAEKLANWDVIRWHMVTTTTTATTTAPPPPLPPLPPPHCHHRYHRHIKTEMRVPII